ncbi:MAG: hypothetical protein RIR10_876, partial [Planctomycetota bacterium]
MQRSKQNEATFISTQSGPLFTRTAVGFIAVALVGTSAWTNSTLAQDAPPEPPPATEPAPAAEPAPAPSAEPPVQSVAPAQSGPSAAEIDSMRTAAREAMARSEWKKAIDLWSTLQTAVPGDAEAMKQMQRAQAALDQGSLINDVGADLEIRKQRAVVQLEASMKRADEFAVSGSYADAESTLLQAKQAMLREKSVFPAAEYNAHIEELDSRYDAVRTAAANAAALAEHESRESANQEKSARAAQEAEKRQKAINERLIRVRQLQMELKYEEAIQVCDEILLLDPNNPAAQALRAALKTSAVYRSYSATEQRRSEAYTNFSKEILERSVPPMPNITGPGARSTTGLLEYPEDWPALSDMRMRDRASGYRESTVNRQAMAALQKAVSVNFNNNQLDQVFSYMNQVSGVEFYPDWKALETIGVRPEDPITLTLDNVPAEVALKRVVEQLGDESDRPDYSVEDGVIVVSSSEQLRKKTITIVYDIRDLLFEVPYFDNAPDFNLSSALSQGGQGQGGGGSGGGFGGGGGGFGGGGGGGGGFGGGGGGSGGGGGGIIGDPGEDPERKSREELIEQITTIIQDQVDPDNWVDNGGDTGKIQELNGNLIITNTARNHRDIEGLLTQLRSIRALQINYEARVIGVTSDWFEQIGVDLDIYFNTNNRMFDQARAADPNFNLSDFFFQDGASKGQLKDPVIFGSW